MVEAPTRKLRVGIVSANWGAIAHLPAWRLVDEIEVSAICTSRPETAAAAAKQFAVARPFWDYQTMCADPDIDIIDAGTSPLLREKIITAALKAGKHVMNQVPFATSLKAAEDLLALQRAQGTVGAAAVSVMGLPHLALMKQMVEAGEIGEVFQVHCMWQLSYFLKIFPGFPYTWFGKSGQGVSVTRNQGSHMLHALREIFGPVSAVVGHMKTQLKTWELQHGESMAVETDDTSHALLRFASGAMGTFISSWTAADAPGFSIDALGSKGRLRLDASGYPNIGSAQLYAAKADFGMEPAGQKISVPEQFFTVSGRAVESAKDDLSGGQRVSLGRLFDGFARAVRLHGDPPASFARAIEVQGIIEAMYQSVTEKSWIEL